jgi:hypothetical protein
MLTALWLVLAALVVARVALYCRREAPPDERPLNRQIYKLQQVVAMAKEDEVFRELLAIARGKR